MHFFKKIDIAYPLVLLLALFAQPLHAYERIISLKPNLTEILFALGLEEKIIGVTEYCQYPKEAKKIEKIGGYSNPNLEKILTLHPDLVVLIPESTSPRIESAIRRAGIETLIVRTEGLDQIYEAIHTIASKTGVNAKGDLLVKQMKEKIADVLNGADIKVPRKALLVIQRKPLIVAGPSTFLGNLLELAGGKNIIQGTRIPYPRPGMETVLSQKPEVILDLDSAAEEGFWSQFPSLPAVKNGQVSVIDPNLFVPGPRLPEALKLLIENLRESSQSPND